MNQLDLLWEYQLADTEADQMEHSIRQSPKRQKLLKLRDYIRDQQESLKTLESEIEAMSDRLDTLRDAINIADEQLKQLQVRIQEEPPTSSQDVKRYSAEAAQLSGTLADYDAEIRRVRKNVADRDHKQRDIKLRAIKSKEEFDQLRMEYDQEFKEKNDVLTRLRAAANEKLKGIDPEHLARYTAIKQHSTPPMAKVQNGSCGGCSMQFPSSVLSAIKSGQQIQCETCGRLIIG